MANNRPWVPGGPETSMMPESTGSKIEFEKQQEKAMRLMKEGIFIWNSLVEDKGPLQQKQDELGWNRRVKELANNAGFQNFMNATTIADKMIALRDTGMRGGYNMTDEQLAQYILKHSPTSLTEDPAVSRETRLLEEEMDKPKSVLDSIENKGRQLMRGVHDATGGVVGKYWGDDGMEKFKEDYPAPKGFWEKYGIK
tara:strand:+ start:709 stop:1299 length:591 start_codon:yes stop_codon:yes gene_type:complete